MSVQDETWDRPICNFCKKEIPYGEKGEHLNKKCVKEDFMPRLKEIQHELKTQDNRCTSDPIFLVEEKERIYGLDLKWDCESCCYDFENDCEISEEEYDKAREKEMDDPSGKYENPYERLGFMDKRKTVQFFFTERAAQDFIDRNKHRHKGELRIYADSLYRNSEMKMIRDYILNLE